MGFFWLRSRDGGVGFWSFWLLFVWWLCWAQVWSPQRCCARWTWSRRGCRCTASLPTSLARRHLVTSSLLFWCMVYTYRLPTLHSVHTLSLGLLPHEICELACFGLAVRSICHVAILKNMMKAYMFALYQLCWTMVWLQKLALNGVGGWSDVLGLIKGIRSSMHACNWSTTVKIEEWKGRSAKIDNLIIHAFVCLNSYKLGTWNCELSLFPCNAAHAVRNVAAAAESLIVNQCNISYKIVLTLHYFLHFTVSVPLSLEYLFQNTCPLQRSRCTSCKFCPYLNAFPTYLNIFEKINCLYYEYIRDIHSHFHYVFLDCAFLVCVKWAVDKYCKMEGCLE